ncbi:MAG TPA: hypothetical protein VGC92_01780, partial [Phenylobacterium sp.]
GPAFAGLLLMEAVKQTFAVKPKGVGARVRRARPLLAPAPMPAPRSPAPQTKAHVSRAAGTPGGPRPLERGGEHRSFGPMSPMRGFRGKAAP